MFYINVCHNECNLKEKETLSNRNLNNLSIFSVKQMCSTIIYNMHITSSKPELSLKTLNLVGIQTVS